MKPEGRYNLRGQIRSRESDRVCRVSDQVGAITKDRVSAKKSSATRGSETSKVYFAQLHFSNDRNEKCHVSRCCLYDQDMPDIPYIHADCIVCFPEPSGGYQLKFKAGKCATSVFQRVIRVRANHPPNELFDGCYFLTKKERYELVKPFINIETRDAFNGVKALNRSLHEQSLFISGVKARLF